MNLLPLFELERDGISEISVFGEIAISRSYQERWQNSETRKAFPARSLLKPFQVLASGILGEKETNPWWHVALGSISNEEDQNKQLRKWIQGSELEDLVKGLHLSTAFPMDDRYRILLKERGANAEVIFHTCFSKHLAILKACKRNQWSSKDYFSETHPFHLELIKILHGFLKPARNTLQFVQDGCGLPSPVLFLDEMAELFRLLACGETEELRILRDQMMASPFWVGGPGRVDTQLMELNPGKLIAKEGADGLLGIGILPHPKLREGLGLVVKISAGYLPHWAALALKPILDVYDLTTPSKVPAGQTIRYCYEYEKPKPSLFLDLSPLINEKLAVWPGDVPFSRNFSYQTELGDHLTLSSIQSSVHLGTHTDAPIHFKKEPTGIDQVPLEKYCGPCQVIEVVKRPGEKITPTDFVNREILAPRLLIKTGSYPDPQSFNEDFNSFSPNAIQYLANKKVFLIGIDTPSIDPFESKDLPAHQETGKTGMAILEGVQLEDVSEGVYELIALPLRIEGADASPVRAVLIK